MVRVLQMIPRYDDSEGAQQIDVLGRGLSADIRFCHLPLGCGPARYQLLRNRIRGRLITPDVVHSWNWSGLSWALAATRCPVVHSIKAIESRGQVRALKKLTSLTSRVSFVCSTSLQKHMLQRAGIPAHRCHIIEPGVETSVVSQDHRTRIRQSLGLDNEEVIAFAPGDSTPTSRHRVSLWALSILHVYDRRYRLLISGTGPQASSLHRLARKLQQPALLVSASQRLGRPVDQSELLAAADIGLLSDSLSASPLPTAMCMTAGIPTIGDADGLAGQYATEESSTLMIRPFRPKLVARHIFEWLPVGAARPGHWENNRPGAAERFDPPRFRRQMSDLYRSVCNGSSK